MNYYWLISNCFFPSVFAFLFILHLFYLCLFCIFLFVVVLLRLCFLPYALNSSHNIYPYLCSFFVVFYFSCSHDAVCFFFVFFSAVFSIFNIFLLLKVMLSCGAAIFHSSPTSNTSVKTVLIISIYPPSFFSVLAWAFLNKNQFTVFNAILIKRFHRVNMVFLGICIVYIDKIYNIFYVLPFFDLVFQRC